MGISQLPAPSVVCHLEERGRGWSSVQRDADFGSGLRALGIWGLTVLSAEEDAGLKRGLNHRPWRWLRELELLVAAGILHLEGGRRVAFTWLPWSSILVWCKISFLFTGVELRGDSFPSKSMGLCTETQIGRWNRSRSELLELPLGPRPGGVEKWRTPNPKGQ